MIQDPDRREEHADVRLRRWTYGTYVGLLALGLTILCPPAPRLIWNVSTSAPTGLYRVYPGTPPARDDMVAARLPLGMRTLAVYRHYLPENVPLIKRVTAIAGDRVCASGDRIRIDGKVVAMRRTADRRGRALPRWTGCRLLGRGDTFLLMADVPDSFDGRYFGVTPPEDVIGRAELLWRR